MTSYSVLIVDDEPLAQIRLQKLLETLPTFSVAAVVGNAEEAREALSAHSVDICLLDIHMPGESGLQLAEAFKTLSPQTQVIFCTAYDEHALEAFGVNAVDYLLKPIRLERLQQALDKAVAALLGSKVSESAQDMFTCNCGNETVRILWSELYACVAEDKYVTLITEGKQHLTSQTLKQLEAEYPERLLRIHRNALINIEKAERLYRNPQGYMVQLRHSDHAFAVSRRHVTPVRERLQAVVSDH